MIGKALIILFGLNFGVNLFNVLHRVVTVTTESQVLSSVTRWQDNLSNIWPFTAMKICQSSIKMLNHFAKNK